MDESISIHENFANVYPYFVRQGWMPGIMQSHEWIPFGVLFVVGIAIVVIPLLRHVNRRTVIYMFIAGAIFLAGAIGFEFLGAVMLEYDLVSSKTDALYLGRRIVEEALEMYGIALFNWIIYKEIQEQPATIDLIETGLLARGAGRRQATA